MNMCFFELVQVGLGAKNCLYKTPDNDEWKDLFDTAEKQCLLGICFAGLDRLHNNHQVPEMDLLMEWLGQVEYIKSRNEQVTRQCVELQKRLLENGVKSCILKGQGLACYYKDLSLYRNPGDIDIWVSGDIKTTVRKVRSIGISLENINIKHADASVFDDTAVEVHFNPSWFYNPRRNKIFSAWVDRMMPIQMKHEVNGLVVPTTDFNIVYILLHIYRHVFDEGIGLRQLLDYFFVLLAWNDDTACQAKKCDTLQLINDLGMMKFASAIMWVLHKTFGLCKDKMFCQPNEAEGEFLLNEIMRGGNFGHYSGKEHKMPGPWMRGIENAKRNVKFLPHYPNEVLWAPFWKVWHWWYRMSLN